jgi:L-arabinokinase
LSSVRARHSRRSTTGSQTLAFYISGHGFGHATRDIEVINQILRTRPGTRIVIRSSVPRWFLEYAIHGPFELQPCEADTGMVQIDSLSHDLPATVAKARAFYSQFERRAAEEAACLSHLDPAAVVGDIPPLAFAAAARAGVPAIALANFTWDWIYGAYDEFRIESRAVLATIREAYACATLALRLPFAGGFEPMAQVTRDIPLVARRSRLGRDRARQALALNGERPIALASFGGHGTALPFERIGRDNDLTLVLTSHESGAPPAEAGRWVRWFSLSDLEEQGIRYEDLVAASDVVISKPGYGIVSECIANRTALLHTSRGHFIERDVFLAEMPRVLRSRFIPQDDLRAGRWREPIDAVLAQPAPPETMAIDGAAVAAALILESAANPDRPGRRM